MDEPMEMMDEMMAEMPTVLIMHGGHAVCGGAVAGPHLIVTAASCAIYFQGRRPTVLSLLRVLSGVPVGGSCREVLSGSSFFSGSCQWLS